jgi:predicted transcriptional regulator
MKSLRDYQKDRYLTSRDFAKVLGISPNTLFRILRGEPARQATKVQIAKKLRVKPPDIEEFANKA